MVDFWLKLLFGTYRYQGHPFRQHLPLPIERDDFGRWYGLFEETVDEDFEGEKANYAKEMVKNIANSFGTRMAMEGKFDNQKKGITMTEQNPESEKRKLAKSVQQACIEAARDGFQDASMSGLCSEGAIEAAISAIQKLDVEQVIQNQK